MTLDSLPMFASDNEIAEAIVGKAKAKKWLAERFPRIAKMPGFPPIDPVHEGRPVKLVRRFYDEYLGASDTGPAVSRGRMDVAAWKPGKSKQRA